MSTARRRTRQRAAVEDLLTGIDEFRTAQQIHALLQASGERVGLTTVYRSLALMAQAGQVDVLLAEDGEARYRACSSGHHHHLVCRECGSTVEVTATPVERW
nr:transcriptional repressor [Actinomycetota bacterium]